MVAGLVVTRAEAFSESERQAIYKAIAARRDVRRGFIDLPLSDDVLQRILNAAHRAPSVGLMQPSRFIVIRDREMRRKIHGIFEGSNADATANYEGEQRERYKSLKLEGIMEAPQNLCIVCDTKSDRGHRLGRHTIPETAVYSTVCAIQNLWLAARSEGVGVGWVSILDVDALRSLLLLPQHLLPVAYLCLGYVDEFADEPELARSGWEKQLPLEAVTYYERYGQEP